ncbi:UNVERIFIED_CONTAM: Filament-like plant protein 7 [Sesamum radiatum]|uniref:Filament-like plant protein 7 n=1 Tax=Sesamum radiatum TaxID=300843 RepID=A0AAW2M406_SESRA
MNLMDDFAEMEKLAVVSANYLAGNFHHEEGNTIIGTSGRESDGHSSSAPDTTADALIILMHHVTKMDMLFQHHRLSRRIWMHLMKEMKIVPNTKSCPEIPVDVSISVHKVLELLEGINIQSQENGASESLSGKDDKLLSFKNTENPTGYMVRVFQWKTAELSTILQQLVQSCNDLLDGTTDLEQFVQK